MSHDYTEHKEHALIQEHVASKGKGFFLDIGANDGVIGSNTRSLWESGWRGILVEASAITFGMLEKNYANRTRVILLRAAITHTDAKELSFFEHSTIPACGWNSLNKNWVDQWTCEGANPFRKVKVPAMRVQDLPLPEAIDFLSIDTEGSDFDILASLPDSIRPRAIMAEMDKFDNRRKITELLLGRGYRRVGGTEYNDLFLL